MTTDAIAPGEETPSQLPALEPPLDQPMVEAFEMPEGTAARLTRPWAEFYMNAALGRAERERGFRRVLPTNLFTITPWARRCIMLRYPPPDVSDILVAPDNTNREVAVGRVFAAGPAVGTPDPGKPGWSPWRPVDLVGREVQFAKYGGHGWHIEESDEKSERFIREYYNERVGHPYVCINDNDIWGEFTLPQATAPRENDNE